jgi:hypothetical protein
MFRDNKILKFESTVFNVQYERAGRSLTTKILTLTAANDQHRRQFRPQEILTSKTANY